MRTRTLIPRDRTCRQLFCLADPTRMAIVRHLAAHGECIVGDIVSAVKRSQPLVSRTLADLRAAGVVHLRRDANYRHYRLNPTPLNALASELAALARDANILAST